MSLDPLRAHYLKKSLLALQLGRELADLQQNVPLDGLLLLSYLVRTFLLSFPFLPSSPDVFYNAKIQPFLDRLFARHFDDDPLALSPTSPLIAKLERTLVVFLSAAIKLVEPEDTLRLSQADLHSLEHAVSRRAAHHRNKSLFRVNIVSVRTTSDRRPVRSRVHEEFIICTTLPHDQQVCVSRRYGDFRTLADELRKAHPDALVPIPPQKDRTAVHAPTDIPPPVPGNVYPPNAAHLPPRLSREKNRLTLRAYLHSLLATSPFSSSPVLRSFLLSGPTTLSLREQEDARRREEADRIRDQGRKVFAREIGARVDHLREAVRSVKRDIVGRDGLIRVFSVIKAIPHVRQLPHDYQAVLEWARISLASTIFQTFVASDNSPETFASLKRTHGLVPYFLLKAALKISNPVAMIRNVLDIFLAQPFGGPSLLQRMFTSSLTEEVRTLNTHIEHVSAKIDCPVLCEKVRIFVYSPRDIQEMYRVEARLQRIHLLRVILMAGEEPALSRSLAERVDMAWRMWSAWMAEKQRERRGKTDETGSDEGPNNEQAWLFEDLKVLINLYARLRDREQLIALISEGVTAELLKDIITIFYTPLAQVYKAANIAESLGDLQNFINDLIHTVEQTEDLSQSDPSSTVQTFIDLVNRHEQSFYTFVHKVHSKGHGLFDSLMKWIERFLSAIREGVGASDIGRGSSKISLETVLPAGGEERARIMEEVDQVMRWHYLNKIAHEEKLRSRFRHTQGGAADADADDEATRALIDSVAGEFDFGDLVRANAEEFAEEDSNEVDEDEDGDDDSDDDSDTTSGEYSAEETSSDEAAADIMPTHKALQVPSVLPATMQPPLSRAGTAQVVTRSTPPATSKPLRSQSSLPPQQAAPRERSLSLCNTKSMKLPSQHSTADAPPVPPLPAPPFKPLPSGPAETPSASLPRRRSTGHLASFAEKGPGGDSHPQSPSPPRSSHKPRRKAATTPQPPELKYIPALLPIFVEVMRPLLRPRP